MRYSAHKTIDDAACICPTQSAVRGQICEAFLHLTLFSLGRGQNKAVRGQICKAFLRLTLFSLGVGGTKCPLTFNIHNFFNIKANSTTVGDFS